MTDAAAESLKDLVAKWQGRIAELRRAGDLVALLTAAEAAANEIERRAGEAGDESERAALAAVKRFTFNAAADCWPGWSIPDRPPDAGILERGLELAKRSAALVEKLGLGPVQEGTGVWLSGAFELALGRYVQAHGAFVRAREHYRAGNAPGLALLTEGYIALLPAQGESLDEVCAKIAAGSFEDGAERIEQLRTARKVFT